MDKELIYKKIDNLISMRQALWTVLVILNGGLAGLLLNMGNPSLNSIFSVKIILLTIGSFFDYFFLICASDTGKDIKKLFNDIEKENK